MNRNRILVFTAVLVVGLVALFLADDATTGTPNQAGAATPETWQKALEQHRRTKDEDFRTGNNSPIATVEQRTFQGLKYYAPDTQYIVLGQFIPALDEPPIVLSNVPEGTEQPEYAGRVAFNLLRQPDTLVVFRYPSDANKLFIPFRDATTGMETYGAGRYLDTAILEDTVVPLDFNYAYNPYCAYSPNYTCPLPPLQNRISIPIRAGERDYAEHGLAFVSR
jgi:uncharacterized protein